MIRRKIMNNKNQENGVLTGPLIFTVPAYGFVMALYLDWLGRPNRAAFSTKTFTEEVEPVEPRRPEPPEQTN
jgi:hypothetical protein